MYRLDHMSLGIKLSQFITSAMDTVKCSTVHFQSEGKLVLIETLETTFTKSLKTYFRER